MFKRFKQAFLCCICASVIIGGTNIVSYATDDITEKEKESIKNTVETFVKEDYNFNGGKNNFSTLGSNDFKEYLKARNDFKQANNDYQDYKPIDSKYTFDFEKIEKDSDNVKVDVYVSETFSYDLEGKRENDASAGNEYDIYLTKIGDSWKIMSATIDVSVDPIDCFFDVNQEFGYAQKNKIDANTRKNNLKKMLDKIEELKSNISSEPPVSLEDVDQNLKEDSAPKLGAITSSQRQAIYDYAYAYRESRRNPNYLSFKADCANYASQALRKAGARADKSHSIKIDGKNRTWSLEPDSIHIQPTYGDAWAQAHYLRAFIVRNENGYRGPGGHAIEYGSTLQLGDLTFIHNGTWFHTYIVVGPGSN
ncbi:amidase domain-containing protein, partial [Clostridioides difficile]|nr:amidase domain-containing protein [Clostridioides difficile]